MLDEILPARAVAVETFTDVAAAVLFPAEAAAISGAARPRRAEFATTRWCARAALARLALPSAPIAQGSHGEPLWPVGTTGSITHCVGYRACALALKRDVAALGIDAEPHRPLPPGLLDAVAFAGEHLKLSQWLSRAPDICWDRLLFSAKESAYKAWFSFAGQLLRFDDAIISFDYAKRQFTVRLTPDGSPADNHGHSDLEGRWLVRNNLIITAVAIRA